MDMSDKLLVVIRCCLVVVILETSARRRMKNRIILPVSDSLFYLIAERSRLYVRGIRYL